jgi:branched-chain amino acid aminotransferase
MTALANERIAYHNGAYVPESRVLLPFRDRGLLYGDGVFDTTRTFRHRIFRLREHVERLYRSLRYVRIDPGLSPAEMCAVTEEVLARNLHLIDRADDYWVSQRVTRGSAVVDREPTSPSGPTVIVECTPLPLRERATLYRDGIRVVVPTHRRTPPEALSPQAKTSNYLNMIVADQEVAAVDPGAWAVLLDMAGNLAEGRGSNLFLVREGSLLTPAPRGVLAGISRQTVIEIAAEIGIPCRETDLQLFDAYTADEAFLTSTSLCICPVRSINGIRVGADDPFGPVTRRLIQRYSERVDCNFVDQYRQYLPLEERAAS